jgi:CHAD domain-containing protein
MMNRFTIQVNNELHALSQLIKKVQKNAGEKKIHRLRVVIKKIRAYYALLPATQSFKKAFPALARLNLAAQALRDLQVLQKNISSLPAWKTAEVASSILNDHLKKK